MRARDLASAGLVLAALWLVAAGLAARVTLEDPAVPRQFFRLAPGEALAFVVPPGALRGRLVTAAVLPEESEPPVGDVAWQLSLTWRDAAGRAVDAAVVDESSRVDWLPGTLADPAIRRSVSLLDERSWVTDTRALYLPLDLLPRGGTLEVRSLGADVLVRPFAELPLPDDRLDVLLDAPSRREAERVARAVRIPHLDVLLPSERQRVLSRSWHRLEPLDGRGQKVRPLVDARPVSEGAQEVRRVRLAPRRTLPVNVVGPARLRISGPPEVRSLGVRCVADGEPCALRVVSADPVGLAGAGTAIQVVRDEGTGPASILLDHPGEAPLDLVLTAPADTVPFGQPPTADLRALYAGEGLPDALWLAPEHHAYDAFVAGAEPVVWARLGRPDDPLRLTLRARLEGPEDRASRTVTVRGLDAEGGVLWTTTLELDPAPAPLEGVDAGAEAPWGWISLPERAWVVPGDAARLAVTASRPVLVRAHALGAPSGSDGPYALPRGDAVVRFAADHATEWREVAPLASGPVAVVRGWVRLEVSSGGGAGEAPTYTTISPPGATEPWLFPRPEGSGAPVACAVRPDQAVEIVDPDAGDWATGVLWAGPDGLDAGWSIALDDRRWRSGRTRQAVTVLRGLAPAFSRAVLEGPANATLWWRGGPATRCPDVRAVRALFRLEPGETVALTVPGPPGERSLLLAGAGAQVAPLHVRLPGKASAGLHRSRTRDTLLLEPGPEVAVPLYDPSLRVPVLRGDSLTLGADVPAGETIEITSRAAGVVWLRALIEGAPEPRAEPERVRVVTPEQGPR